jgi:O-antigen ligase
MYRYLIVEGPLIKVYSKHTSFNLYALDDDTFRLVGLRGELINKVEKPETLGFTDKEKIGSSRGYIWSRTIPLLKDSFIKGFGPDNFAIAFPQDDYIGKIRAFSGGANMIVDKPHNMYLQIATNTGVLSLIAFLALAGIYAIQSFITYVKIEKNFMTYAGAGIFLAICGYLVTNFFNDSVVGIAPIFWVLLGLGFICNKMVRKQNASV